MSGEVVYNLPKKQLTNTTFTNLLASSTGDSPYADSNVVSGGIVATGDEVPNSQKYYEIKIVFGEHNFYVYQNVQTGGYMHVENNEEGTNVTESTTATLWDKIVADTHYYQVSPAKPPPTNYSSQSHVFIKISSDNVERPLTLGGDGSGTTWSIRDAVKIEG